MSETIPPILESEPAAGPAVDPLALIQAISGGAADPGALLLSQIAGQAPDDPRIATVLQLLQQRAAAGRKVQDVASEEDERARREAQRAVSEHEREAAELRDTAQKMARELDTLRRRNDALAASLGACFLCFGVDPFCDQCAGIGTPGWKVPDAAAYRLYVLPALERIRRLQAERVSESRKHPQGAQAAASAAML
jgi:hypothetical protein